jgi:photosystem II stability/assembly factor-like uncharacterized protein
MVENIIALANQEVVNKRIIRLSGSIDVAAVCEHGKSKYRCKECGGNFYCTHGRRKTRCLEGCGGSAFCVLHGKRKDRCKECNPPSKFCLS